TPPVLLHLMQGMYLPIIVDPKGGWPGKVDKEFVIVQSEFYVQGGDSALPGQADWKQALDREASYVVFNGRAFQYQEHPLQVDVGDRVRVFVVSAGPSFTSDFHIVGTVAVLNRMLERIDAAFKNQRRLTADVSHELRSPLTALRGEFEVALRAERSPRD